MTLLGRANWWLPAWLDRLLPGSRNEIGLPVQPRPNGRQESSCPESVGPARPAALTRRGRLRERGAFQVRLSAAKRGVRVPLSKTSFTATLNEGRDDIRG